MSTIREIIGAWENEYPQAFDRRCSRPLKIGIHEDLLAEGYGLADVTLGLRCYCSDAGYLLRQRAGAVRIDLAGQPCGLVTDKEAAHATTTLGKLLRAAQKKRSVPQPVQGSRAGFEALRAAARARRERQHEVAA
ncbi:MAG: hypothetical protein E5Y73_31670 [Mesorhizobium sp.]|uniref:ProQ/FinO family protein n=1 Tax=Mesorhizobium sp. TaxID=1871066 RepID=UPI00121833EC|nr:ProQ/FinO family protein [Mesorhizobium sp.]TIL84756.1 MAG: hypothetical protein E5Y73_31670 [Mesorhizobium sp.]